MLIHCWPIVSDSGPTLNQHWFSASCLLGPGFGFPSVAMGGGPRVVVSTAAFHARVRGSVLGLGGFKETKMFLPHPRVKVSIVGSLRQGPNFESCVWRTVSSQSSHHPQEVFLAQFSLYVHTGGAKPDSFNFISVAILPWLCRKRCKAIFTIHYQLSTCLPRIIAWICIILMIVVSIRAFAANKTRWNNDVSKLVQRLRRWPNIKTSLFQRVVFAGTTWASRTSCLL